MLFAFIYSIVRNRNTAEDCFQDVTMIAFQKCGEFQEGTDFGAWVREIARRRILKAREGAARAHVLLEPAAIDAVAAAHDRQPDGAWEEREAALRQCLERLPERSRRLVAFRYREALDFDAIAGRVQSTAGSIQVVLSKIRQTLRRCIESRLAEPS
jgi:RNA polymerase sigma-70 factor (ECF subfamily)